MEQWEYLFVSSLIKMLITFCLQTDDLVGRLRAHRLKEGMQDATILYIVVPGKSVACQLETLLINQLPLKGFKLMNKADGKHRNFGISPSSGDPVVAHLTKQLKL
jgi:hypothetical protein